MDAKDLLIIIPARGGSKGLPGKNIKQLGTLPLLIWSALAVRDSSLEDVTAIVSTDDEAIQHIALQYQLQTPFLRPKALASDEASAIDVVTHGLDWYNAQYGYDAKYVMWLQPTSPFRPPQVVDEAYKTIQRDGVDAVVGVKPIRRSLQTLFYCNKNTQFLEAFETRGEVISRRQAVKTCYTPNGAMYLIRTKVFRREKTFYPANTHPLIMNAIHSHDIDDETDWAIAEALVAQGLSWRN